MGSNARQLGYLLLAIFILSNFSTELSLASTNDAYSDSGLVVYRDTGDVPVVYTDINGFFKSFDKNNNNELEWSEADNFYNWVRKNIQYRYDDEYEKNPIKNSIVGDGRAGNDYQQSPKETFFERAGDCEDHAMLHVAFFRYWGHESKLGIVKIKDNSYHALAVVNMDEFSSVRGAGEIYYYDIDFIRGKYYGVSPGRYLMVDSTYGRSFGHVALDKITDTSLLYTK